MNIPLTPIRCLYRAVDLYGRKEAVISGMNRYTYSEFGERCERLAGGLIAQGVQRGDRVALLSFNNHQFLEEYYGAPLIDAVVTPINVRLGASELTEILNHAEPTILIFEAEFASAIPHFRKACPGIRHYVAIDGADAADLSYDELLTLGRIQRPDIFSFDENEIAELFYTSGSTGTPKGVTLSHRTLYLHALAVTGSINQNDRVVELHTIPLFHANGWSRPQTATMNGAKQVMVNRFVPSEVLRLIEQEQVTGMALVPTMCSALLDCPDLDKFDLSSLQDIHLGGAATSPQLIERMEKAFGCRVMAGYGMTETGPMATTAHRKGTVCYSDREDRLRRLAMAGWPIIGTEVRVGDEDLCSVPQDICSVGEVVIRGDNVMDGYFRDEETTKAAMANGWFRTGDLAVWDEENYVEIVDRKKDIIIRGGENISSIEIENAILCHPAVLECAVVAAPHEKWGEIPVAIIVLKQGQLLRSDELLTFLETRLAKFKLPGLMQFVEESLPRTITGKILKRELREPLWAGKTRRVQGY